MKETSKEPMMKTGREHLMRGAGTGEAAGRTEARKNLLLLLATALSVLVVDQASKALVLAFMKPYTAREVVPGLFNLVYVENRGAAFGILNRAGSIGTVFLVIVSLAALGVIYALLRKTRDRVAAFALSLIAGGAVGNLIDRLRFGFVVDFLDFYLGRYHWPAFNAADSAITVGVILAFYAFYLRRRD